MLGDLQRLGGALRNPHAWRALSHTVSWGLPDAVHQELARRLVSGAASVSKPVLRDKA